MTPESERAFLMRVSCRVMLAGFADRETTQTPEKYKSPMLQYHTVPVTAFQQNCSLVWCDQTMDAAVIDPGGDIEQIEGRWSAWA
jgi:hypothetical protein